MTQTPEQTGYTTENIPLADRLLRVRNALIELKLARYSVGLQSYYHPEIEAAYVAARLVTRQSRVELDKADRDAEVPEGVIPEYVHKLTDWETNAELEHFLGSWLEPERRDKLDKQLPEDSMPA